MKLTVSIFLTLVLFGCLTCPTSKAVEVSSSKDQGEAKEKNDKSGDGPGFLSGIFGGANEEDRNKKLERVMGIKREDFNLTLTLEPTTLSHGSVRADTYSIQAFLTLENKGRMIRTFNFLTSQKYDFFVLDKSGKEILRWSQTVQFPDTPGKTIINPGEKIRFTEIIPLLVNQEKLPAGDYTVVGIIKDFDDFRESIPLKINP